MKRIAMGVGLALAVGAAAWTGAWWWAAQTMTDRLDAELAALADAGVTVTAASRRVGGFPFRLELHQTDVGIASRSGLWRLDVGEAVSGASLFAPDRVRTVVGGAGMQRVGTLVLADSGATMAEFAVGAQGLVVDTPLDPAAPVALITAEALSLVDVAGTALHEASIDFLGLSARVERHAVPAIAQDGHKLSLQAALLEVSAAPVSIVPQRTQLTAEGFRLDGTLAGLRGSDLASALAAPGQLVLGVEAADVVLLSMEYAPPVAGAPVDLDALPVAQAIGISGRLGQRLTVADGRVALETTGSGLVLDLAHPALGGRFVVPEAVTRLMVPMRHQAAPEPFAVEVRLTGIQPDGSTWTQIDPRNRLDRGPLALAVDIRGEARSLMVAPLGPQSPLRVEQIDIHALDFSGFGATLSLTGALTPVLGQPEPDGTLRLRLDGWSSLLRALETVGVLDPLQSMLVAEVASGLRDPDVADALRAEVELSRGGVVVNGRRYR